jgi:hypothetical protein
VEGEEDIMSGHFIKQCKHGRLVTQCRCFSKDKRVEIVACVSRACLDEGVVDELDTPTEWPQDETTTQRMKLWGQDS